MSIPENIPNLFQYALFMVIIIITVEPVGRYLTIVFAGQNTWLDPALRPVERAIYRLAGVDERTEMNWRQYATAFVVFGLVGTLLLAAILLIQHFLPWYYATYQGTPMTWDLALNTAISFATTTTWQAYAGETTMSYFSQLMGLTVQNFLAGAAGLAVGIAFIRGLMRQRSKTIGNFWVDLTRSLLWVLLPLSLVSALILVAEGVPMNFNPYVTATTVEGAQQTIAQGPVAALETIKNFGANGGGFFNTNAAHPYENPSPLSNFLEMLMIVILPAGLTYTFGEMTGRPRQGWLIFWVMTILFVAGLWLGAMAEQGGNVALNGRGIDMSVSAAQAGGNLEGKEVRFGIHGSVLGAIATSNGATGSYNSMHDSYTPLGGMIPLINMLLGEVIYGGLGTGLYSMIIFVLLSVFVGGLMVGHTPAYLGKLVTIPEMKLIGLYTIFSTVTILLLTAIAVAVEAGRAGLTTNPGIHGFTEIFYAYTSSFANNGQNFAGLSANSVFYNLTTGIAMLVGRFGLTIVALALAGYFGEQGRRNISSGTLSTDTPIFAVLLLATTIIVGALSYLPAVALGPVIEHLLLNS